MNKRESINLLKIIHLRGEAFAENVISTFSCSNYEVDTFIHKDAISFAKTRKAITYLYLDDEGSLLGYYTISTKPFILKEDTVSKSTLKRLLNYEFDDKNGRTINGFLLAQLGKNEGIDNPVHGNELLNQAISTIIDIMNRCGNEIIWLECEDDNVRAITLYESEEFGFCQFDNRIAENEYGKEVHYRMYLKYLKSKQLDKYI